MYGVYKAVFQLFLSHSRRDISCPFIGDPIIGQFGDILAQKPTLFSVNGWTSPPHYPRVEEFFEGVSLKTKLGYTDLLTTSEGSPISVVGIVTGYGLLIDITNGCVQRRTQHFL